MAWPLLGDQALGALANYFAQGEDEKCTNLLLLEHSFGTLARDLHRDVSDVPTTHTSKPTRFSIFFLIHSLATEHKRKREDDDTSGVPVSHTSKPTGSPPFFLIHPFSN